MTRAVDTLFAILETRNITRMELAQKMGVTRNYLNTMKCKKTNIGIDTVKCFAEALDCEVIIRDKETGLDYKI